MPNSCTSSGVQKVTFTSIEDVRSRIDRIDSELVKMIAQRAECVKAAAAFKTDSSAVRAPERVQQVIDRVREKATEAGLPEVIIEKVYRCMIGAFIEYELEQHQQLQQQKTDVAR
ncbi:Salicylate biosynthesis protein pchB [Raoultella terrigena]|nr:Salicylate biosynthesis protein pchB [Raoultella terrigena]